MSEERIEKSKSAVESADHIPAEKKAELLGALSKFKPGIIEVSQTHTEHAQNIVRLVEDSAREAAGAGLTSSQRKQGPIRRGFAVGRRCSMPFG